MPALIDKEPDRLEKLHPAKEVEGQLFICDIRLYKTLYSQLLKKSGGNLELARKYTHQAITNDGTSLVQENISTLKDKSGSFIVNDLRLRASMQQTPTRHVYYQTKDQNTGHDIITSPEYRFLGESITTALTDWRRGNDKAAMRLVQSLHLTLPPNQAEDGKKKVDYTLLWASPTAENWEDPLIQKYNGEYGYLYVGRLTEEAGVRKMVVHSFKADLKTASYMQLLADTKGVFHHLPEEINPDKVYKDSMAELRDDVDSPKRPLLDHLMRTVAVVDGQISDRDIISRLYKSKKEVEDSDRMFGIKEETMQFIQNSNLRNSIENEVSTQVADWLIDQITKGVADDVIQGQIRDKYISYTRALVGKMKQLEIDSHIHLLEHRVVTTSVVNEQRVMEEDLRKMQELRGAFCGDWGDSPSSISEILKDLQNYTGISGSRLGSGGGFTKEGGYCLSCSEHNICTDKCYKCGGRLI